VALTVAVPALPDFVVHIVFGSSNEEMLRLTARWIIAVMAD
jgi:hypothetical protein